MAKTKAKEPKKMGRPTKYSPELAEKICKAIATSTLGVKKLCDKYDWFPCRDTIFTWRIERKDFSDLYTQAKRDQAEAYVDELMDIADASALDSEINDNGQVVPNHEYMQRSRLRIDTRKWIASKLIPKLYGDKIQTEHSGEIKISHEDALKELE